MMKMIIMITLFLSSYVFAFDIDTQIAQIKSASPKERVALMNQLKMKIATMNAKERQEMILQLQQSLQKDKTNKNDLYKNHVRIFQEQEYNHMKQMQEMQQHHIIEEYIEEKKDYEDHLYNLENFLKQHKR